MIFLWCVSLNCILRSHLTTQDTYFPRSVSFNVSIWMPDLLISFLSLFPTVFSYKWSCWKHTFTQSPVHIQGNFFIAPMFKGFWNKLPNCWGSLVAQLVKKPPAMQETLVRCLGQEDPPGEGIGYPPQYSWVSLVAPTNTVTIYFPAPSGTVIWQHPSPYWIYISK